jgi:hypothetical protein
MRLPINGGPVLIKKSGRTPKMGQICAVDACAASNKALFRRCDASYGSWMAAPLRTEAA